MSAERDVARAEFKDHGVKPFLILDGGLGTTLEDFFHKDISMPLWSAEPVDTEPEVIIAAHLAFLRAGADIILTSTYQCARETFERSGKTKEDATRIMREAVKLAIEARRRHLEGAEGSRSAAQKDIKIALSIGPYGATLSPAQEFDGFYPPPYGPQGFSSSPQEGNRNTFPDSEEGRAQEAEATNALTAFHIERLREFAEDAETWDAVDFVAFETVPLLREIKAIRKAMSLLQSDIGEGRMKLWWVSTVYPGGRFPQTQRPGGERVTAGEVVEAALCAEDNLPEPWGLGINCTDPRFLSELLQQMTSAVDGTWRREDKSPSQRPWLVVYPNRGDVYDVTSQTWSSSEARETGESWARRLWDVVRQAMTQDVWYGVIVGGCCKTGPEEIAGLASTARDLLCSS